MGYGAMFLYMGLDVSNKLVSILTDAIVKHNTLLL